jgi:hypothetical protein
MGGLLNNRQKDEDEIVRDHMAVNVVLDEVAFAEEHKKDPKAKRGREQEIESMLQRIRE